MSDPEHDGEDKGFLARWSQRKQEAKQGEPKVDAPAAETAEPAEADGKGVVEEFDLASLPKLEDITGTTDISAFLRKGVPEHLRNAALRKSWALDPAVRNYVSPALEYAYDWNTPGGVPGGGELGAGVDVARVVSQIMGDGPRSESATPASEAPAGGPSSEPAAVQKAEVELPTEAVRRGDEAASGAEHGSTAAVQRPKSEADDPVASQQPVRRHGSAKPTV